MKSSRKITPISQLQKLGSKLRKMKRKIVFTNGTFDILHLGHVDYLQKAKACGNVLVVGVNSDQSVRSYKGPKRPINSQQDRMRVLAALECVDHIVLFNDPTPLRLILKLRPHVLVKGADWKKKDIVGAKEVESWRGKVKRMRMVPGRSTTAVIKRVKRAYT